MLVDEGCASRVVILCCTFWNGSAWYRHRVRYLYNQPQWHQENQKFFDDSFASLDLSSFEGEHGLSPLKEASDILDRLVGWTNIEGMQILAIRGESRVIIVDKLLCDGVDIHWHIDVQVKERKGTWYLHRLFFWFRRPGTLDVQLQGNLILKGQHVYWTTTTPCNASQIFRSKFPFLFQVHLLVGLHNISVLESYSFFGF